MSMNYVLSPELETHRGSLRVLFEDILTPQRIARFSDVLDGRTRAVLPVFQDTHHCHNISAVLRTADALGFQDAFFVYHEEYRKPRVHDTVERGASRWLSLRRPNSVAECARVLHAAGYAIALVSLPNFPVSAVHYQHHLPTFSNLELGSHSFSRFLQGRRLALVFGNESEGVADVWNGFADLYCYVQMSGFVESLNLSVCAGILLGRFRELIDSGVLWAGMAALTSDEREYLFDHWSVQTFPNGRLVVKDKAPILKDYFAAVSCGAYFRPFVQNSTCG